MEIQQYIKINDVIVPNCSRCLNMVIQDSLECDRCWANCPDEEEAE